LHVIIAINTKNLRRFITVKQDWKNLGFWNFFYRFLGFLGFIGFLGFKGFLGFLGFNVHNAEYRYDS